MKKFRLRYFLFLFCLAFTVFLSGCVSPSESPSPRFYTLQPADKDKITQRFDTAANTVIGVGPVKIPGYMNRPQIVTRDKNKMLKFAQFDRWAESLDTALTRLINENLTIMLPQATIELFPWNLLIPLRYQVIADIIKIESQLDGDLILVAQWSIIDLDKKTAVFTKRSEFLQPINPHNYAGLAEALSIACTALSSQIADAFSSGAFR